MGALDRIRVIDFGHYVAGPVAGMLLADQGAEVIKIDPPGGPVFKTPANSTWNRGKKSICLDLKINADLEIARRLIESADVLLENFRPGVMERLGLGEKSFRKTHPHLIYASMPGFAADDARAALPGWEGAIMAATDVFRPIAEYRDMVQMLHQTPEDRVGTPVFTAEPIASVYAGMITSLAVTTAIYERLSSGRGQAIEVSLFDAMLQAVGILAMSRIPFVPVKTPVFSGFDHQYQCQDGRWVHIVATVPRHGERFLSAIDREDLIEKGLAKRGLPGKPELNKLLIRTLTDVFKTRPAIEWENLFLALGIPGAMCRSTREWMEHPQATETDLLATLVDPVLGKMRQPGLQVKLSETPGEIRHPAPLPDQHREEILVGLNDHVAQRIDFSASETSDYPLQGLKVLDLCIILAGPTCGRSLAELGADVIKIDDPSRGEVLYHHDINRGKRSILLDLKTKEGLDVFWELVDSADVIVQNYRSGVVESLGIDYDSVKARKPDIIYASLNAFGDNGPWEHQPGYEEVAQALTGMQVRFGGEEKPILWPYGVVNDYGTGFAGAFGVMMALIEKSRTGIGQHVTSALARTACTLQSAFLQDYEGKVWDEPVGPEILGSGPLQRLYECQGGWFFLGAKSRDHVAKLISASLEEDLEVSIGNWCAQRKIDDVVRQLSDKDCVAHKLIWLDDFASDPELSARHVIMTRDHDRLGMMRTTGPAHWFSRSRITAGRPAPIAGSDSVSIFHELSRNDLDALAALGVVQQP